MALKGNFLIERPSIKLDGTTDTITFNYAVISTFRGDRYSVNLDVFLCNNINDELVDGAFQSFTFTPDWEESKNIIKQGYEYIKTLPMFAGSEDVKPSHDEYSK